MLCTVRDARFTCRISMHVIHAKVSTGISNPEPSKDNHGESLIKYSYSLIISKFCQSNFVNRNLLLALCYTNFVEENQSLCLLLCSSRSVFATYVIQFLIVAIISSPQLHSLYIQYEYDSQNVAAEQGQSTRPGSHEYAVSVQRGHVLHEVLAKAGECNTTPKGEKGWGIRFVDRKQHVHTGEKCDYPGTLDLYSQDVEQNILHAMRSE